MYAISKKFNLVLAVALALGLLFAAAPQQVRAQEGTPQTLNVASWTGPVDTGVDGRETVLFDGTNYHMWYSNSAETAIYHTSSTNSAAFGSGALVTFSGGTPAELGSVSVVKEGSTFYMIAYGADNQEFAIYTSADGTAWTFGGVIFEGSVFTDYNKIDGPYLFLDGSTYRLYFQVKTPATNPQYYHIYLAEATGTLASIADGNSDVDFTLNSTNPVLSPGGIGTWDAEQVMHPWVVKDGSNYYMWYSGWGTGFNQQVGMAKSTDGLTWVKSPANPIFAPATGYAEPSVITDGETWQMWTMGTGGVINHLTATGPFEFSSIQAAIDAANPGDTINVAAGSYPEDVLIDKSLVILGPNSEISPVTAIRQSEAVVKSFRTLYSTPLSGVTIKGFEVTGQVHTESSLAGIYVGITQNVTIEHNFIHHVEDHGIAHFDTPISNLKVIDNKLTNIIGDLSSGVYVGYLTNSVVSGNLIDTTGYGGILLTADSTGVDVIGNVISNTSGVGIQVSSGLGDIEVSDNIIANAGNGLNEPDKGGIRIYGAGLTGVVSISDNSISGSKNGIGIRDTATCNLSQIEIYHNSIATSNEVQVYNGCADASILDVTNNWWGSAAGPGASKISGKVDFTPWCTDATCEHTAPDASGNVNLSGSISVPGGILINESNLIYHLAANTVIQNNSPCFVVNASYTQIIAEPGAKCIPTGGANGINVAAGLTDIRVKGLEIDGYGQSTGDGIHFAGVVTDVLLVDNKIHDMDGDGVEFFAQPTGVIDIHGNLFQNNGGVGINNANGTSAIDATYNSWGSYGGPTVEGGDGVSANVTYTPWTHADITVAPVISNTTSRVVTTLANVSGRPTVLKDGNVYHMWYGTSDSTLYHTSSTNPAEFPAGVETTFDTKPFEVASPAIIKEADGFKMIAYGADNSEFALYTSADGTAWTKVTKVFDGNDHFTTDFGKIDAPFLFKLDSGYRLYFQVKNAAGTRYNIYAAEAATIGGTYDLVNNDNPVLSPAADTAAWDGTVVMHPWVVKDGTNYYMWFSAHNGTNQRIGVATSTNGLDWTKSAANPVIGPVGEPAVIKDGSIWRIWYLGEGNSIKYETALDPLALRQTLAYQVTANLQNVIAADVTLNFPASLLSIAEITPGPAFNSVTFKTTPDGSIQFIGAKLSEPVVPVTGENLVLFTVAFHTDTQGSGDITFGPATFGMPGGVGSSSNVYLAASADTASAQVNELPTLTTTFGDAYYLVGDPQTFQVAITNKGTAYANAELRLGVPSGVTLTLNTTGYSLSNGVVDLVELGVDETVELTFSATISSAGAKTMSFDVYDASSLLFSTVETATVYTKPAISSTDITGPYQQGVAKNFTVNVNNVDSMYTPNSFTLHFDFPEGTTLVFGGVTYSCGTSGCDVPLTLAVPNNALTFTVTFNAAWNAPATITLIDGQVDPDRTLATFTTTTNVVVYGNIASVTGTVSMQGRTYRGGVLFTLTGPSGFIFGPYSATSIDQISNNVVFANLASNTYTITVTQARYLEVPAALSKTINIGTDTSIAALVLLGGDVLETGTENNVINVNDASLIGGQYGQTGGDKSGDANFDLRVNIFDLALVGGNYGLTSATAYDTEWMP